MSDKSLTKVCSKCKRRLPTDMFYKDKTRKDGLRNKCKDCDREIKRKYTQTPHAKKLRKINQKKYRQTLRGKTVDKAVNRKHRLKREYNMTVKEYSTMLQQQNGVCAICGKSETHTNQGGVMPLSIDHNHKTGKVRGLLCARCNITLGFVKDNKNLLLKLAIYLEEKDG